MGVVKQFRACANRCQQMLIVNNDEKQALPRSINDASDLCVSRAMKLKIAARIVLPSYVFHQRKLPPKKEPTVEKGDPIAQAIALAEILNLI